MNRTELQALPAVVDVPTAARVMGMSRTAAYELIRSGGWPTPVFRLGKLIRLPTMPMLDLLGVHDLTSEQGAIPDAVGVNRIAAAG